MSLGSAASWRRSSSIGTERAPAMWPGVELGRRAGRRARRRRPAQPGGELVAVDDFDAVAVAEVGGGESLEPGDVSARRRRARPPTVADPVAGQRVVDPGAVAAGDRRARPGPTPADGARCWRRSGRSRRRSPRPSARLGPVRRRSRRDVRSPAPWPPRRTLRTARPSRPGHPLPHRGCQDIVCQSSNELLDYAAEGC